MKYWTATVILLGVVLSTVTGLEAVASAVFMFASLAMLWTVLIPAIGVCDWRSHGASAEYLASIGVEYRCLRRTELLCGLTLSALALAAFILVQLWMPQQTFAHRLPVWRLTVVLAGACVALALLASNRGFLDARRRRVRVHATAGPLLFCGLVIPKAIAGWVFGSHFEEPEKVIASVVSVATGLTAALLLFALWRWLASWRESSDELALREAEAGRAS